MRERGEEASLRGESIIADVGRRERREGGSGRRGKSSGAKGQTVCDKRTINRTKTPEGEEKPVGSEVLRQCERIRFGRGGRQA